LSGDCKSLPRLKRSPGKRNYYVLVAVIIQGGNQEIMKDLSAMSVIEPVFVAKIKGDAWCIRIKEYESKTK